MTRYAILFAALLGLTACDETVRGFGEDVEDAGDAIEERTDEIDDDDI